MRTIEWTSQFKKDYKRESKGLHRSDLENVLFSVVELLATNQPLEQRHRVMPFPIIGKIIGIVT